jgi:hypothetical protein
MKLGKRTLAALSISLAMAAPLAHANFVEYIIRGNATEGLPTIGPVSGGTEIVIAYASQKAALGSNDINGLTLGSLLNVSITRFDERSRFAAGSGPFTAPYLNFWITNGSGKFAVVANEPSNGDFQPLYNNGYDLTFAELSDKSAKIYEVTDMSWLPNNGVGLTFADLAAFKIQAPTVAEFNTPWLGLGGGAPRELGTNLAYGVNWVFGDTLANYVSGDQGYLVSNASVRAGSSVPDSASTVTMMALSLAGLIAIRRKFARA